MKGLAVTMTVTAISDIRDIVRYIAQDNSSAARKFEDEFWLAVDRIRVFPQTGYAVPQPDGAFLAVRVSARFKHYSIIYHLLSDEELEVVRVLHGTRDMRAFF